MFTHIKTDWKLLAKYLAGETNAKETAEVTAWIDHDSANKARFQEIKSDWNKMNKIEPKFDVDGAWNKLHNRLITDKQVSPDLSFAVEKRRIMPVFIRIAASLLLVVALGTAYFISVSRFQKITVTASVDEKGKIVKLPDGSVVTLNANATFSYPRQFRKSNREVQLIGEAFFEVSPDKERPFRIHAGDANIRVLGTSFNVNTNKGRNQVEVYVSTGTVELSEAADAKNNVLLHAGNIGRLNSKSVEKLQAENQNSIAWKTGNLTFSDTPLYEVTPLLNDVFHVQIKLRGVGLDTIAINGSYQGDPLDVILNVICQQNNLTIAKSEDTIYLAR